MNDQEFIKQINKKLERRSKMRKFGKDNPFYGKHHTEEHKRKISEKLKGIKRKPVSEETRKKMSNSHKGKRLADVHKLDCLCSFCKAKRGEIKGKDSPKWKGGSRQYWQSLSRKVWEEYHGRKIPEGYLIHHKDENWRNIDPENLELTESFPTHMKKHRQLRRLKCH